MLAMITLEVRTHKSIGGVACVGLAKAFEGNFNSRASLVKIKPFVLSDAKLLLKS